MTPASGTAPLHVTMQLTEQNGAAGKFSITWGDGSSVETLTASTTTTHNYDVAESYKASVVATVGGKTQPTVEGTVVTVDAA